MRNINLAYALGIAGGGTFVPDAEDTSDSIPEGWNEDGQYHCCLHCGYRPIEGMEEFRRIWGHDDAPCLSCGLNLAELEKADHIGKRFYE